MSSHRKRVRAHSPVAAATAAGPAGPVPVEHKGAAAASAKKEHSLRWGPITRHREALTVTPDALLSLLERLSLGIPGTIRMRAIIPCLRHAWFTNDTGPLGLCVYTSWRHPEDESFKDVIEWQRTGPCDLAPRLTPRQPPGGGKLEQYGGFSVYSISCCDSPSLPVPTYLFSNSLRVYEGDVDLDAALIVRIIHGPIRPAQPNVVGSMLAHGLTTGPPSPRVELVDATPKR